LGVVELMTLLLQVLRTAEEGARARLCCALGYGREEEEEGEERTGFARVHPLFWRFIFWARAYACCVFD
jgi:hypothetical protein